MLPVQWQDVSFDDPLAGHIEARVYHPEGEGPYPLAVFLHGWLGSAWMYDEVCTDLAARGFVVASLDTETGLILDMDRFADDAVALLHWVDQDLGDLVSDEPWTALGHSMGGATLAHLLELEPQIRTAVAFMPYEGFPSYYEALETWTGSLLLLAGTHDTTAPPPMQHRWMDSADETSRSLLLELTDMGHSGVTDLTFQEDPMPDAQQRAIVISLASTFVLAEHGGDEALWKDLVAREGLQAEMWSRSHAPALWAELQDGVVSLGVVGLPGAEGEVLFGDGPEDPEPFSAAPLSLEAGVASLTLELPRDWTGDLWVSARLDSEDGERWTRAVPLVTGTEPEPLPEGPPADEPALDETAASPSDSPGCATRPGPALLWSALLGLAFRRRSGRTRQ